jgi:hypothetical protein
MDGRSTLKASKISLPVPSDQLPMHAREQQLIKRHQALVDSVHSEAHKYLQLIAEASSLEKRASELEDWDDEVEADKRRETRNNMRSFFIPLPAYIFCFEHIFSIHA